MKKISLIVGLISVGLIISIPLRAQQTPAPAAPAVTEGTFVLPSHTFRSGEKLDDVKLHYRTLGAPRKDAQGIVRNAVLVMHGTGGSGSQFTGRGFAGDSEIHGADRTF